jgi:hypothetical protein
MSEALIGAALLLLGLIVGLALGAGLASWRYRKLLNEVAGDVQVLLRWSKEQP